MITNVVPADLQHEQTWRELEAKLRPFIAKRARGVDVDDVLQEVFLRIQRGLSDLGDGHSFGAWVNRIASRAIVDHHRCSKRHPVANSNGPEPSYSREEFGAKDAAREVAFYARLFIGMLPSPYREVLFLKEVRGLTQSAAADEARVTLSTMKSRVQRGRKNLDATLEDCCHIVVDARRCVIDVEPRTDGKLPGSCCE